MINNKTPGYMCLSARDDDGVHRFDTKGKSVKKHLKLVRLLVVV